MREYIATGKTVEEAIETGRQMLGADRDEIEFEIIRRQAKKLFRTVPAEVRVFIPGDDPEEQVKKQEPKKEIKRAPEKKSEPVKTQPQKEQSATPAPKPAPKRETQPRSEEKIIADPITPVRLDGKSDRAVEYIGAIIGNMGLEGIDISVAEREDGATILLEGKDVAVLIGRRGETLDALQYLTSLVANRGATGYYKITVDSSGYRAKREQTLQSMARKMAKQAVRTGRSTALEPMNPYERRIIHSAVQSIEGAVSKSVGSEPNRKVVISSKDRPARPPKSGSDGRPRSQGRDRDRRGRDGRDRREKPPVIKDGHAHISDGDDLDLFEKIEL